MLVRGVGDAAPYKYDAASSHIYNVQSTRLSAGPGDPALLLVCHIEFLFRRPRERPAAQHLPMSTPMAHPEKTPIKTKNAQILTNLGVNLGARYRTRTCDLLHVKQMLYQLS